MADIKKIEIKTNRKENVEKMYLFHKKIYWINDFDNLCYSFLRNRPVKYTHHLIEKLICKNISEDKLNNIIIQLQSGIRYFGTYGIFEVGLNKYLEKFAIRVPYSINEDLCIVFQNDYDTDNKIPYLAIKTCWLNNKNDNHYTLNTIKYSSQLPSKWKSIV